MRSDGGEGGEKVQRAVVRLKFRFRLCVEITAEKGSDGCCKV